MKMELNPVPPENLHVVTREEQGATIDKIIKAFHDEYFSKPRQDQGIWYASRKSVNQIEHAAYSQMMP